jgi:DNA (cytosine-5)-methyltransferase 1
MRVRRRELSPEQGFPGSVLDGDRTLAYPAVVAGCDTCQQDLAFLRQATRPSYETDEAAIRVVDLFCGCGGLTLGVAEAARRLGYSLEIPLAVDSDTDALTVFEHNFPGATTEAKAVEELFDGELGSRLTPDEKALRRETGRVDVLAGGPPCQGHSDLNNHTRRRDPRNALYDRMARAAEVLEPSVVVIENVPAVVRDAAGVVGIAEQALRDAGYAVAHRTMNLGKLGVPQRRRRHLLIAFADYSKNPMRALDQLAAPCAEHPTRSVRWAIEDLEDLESDNDFDRAPTPTEENARRIAWLFTHGKHDLDNSERPKCHREKKHTYNSMYGRLSWDEPAQTITTGFGSMGQGRYVHPSQPRTITPHEAARLQGFPDFFDFGVVAKRTAWARLIGNAVPPLLASNVATVVIPQITANALEKAA